MTLEGFGDMLKRFLAEDPAATLIHPQSNYQHWLFNANGNYTFASIYNNFGECPTTNAAYIFAKNAHGNWQKLYRGVSSKAMRIKLGSDS